jgi:hypothetical protein
MKTLKRTTENCRFSNAELSVFAKFLHYDRTANNNNFIIPQLFLMDVTIQLFHG